MAWRFRRVFGHGPFRWSLTKRGIGWSVGISGFRFGVSANGQRHLSMGIPGTGLYWVKNLDSKMPPQPSSSQHDNQVNASAVASQSSPNARAVEPWWKQKGIRD